MKEMCVMRGSNNFCAVYAMDDAFPISNAVFSAQENVAYLVLSTLAFPVLPCFLVFYSLGILISFVYSEAFFIAINITMKDPHRILSFLARHHDTHFSWKQYRFFTVVIIYSGMLMHERFFYRLISRFMVDKKRFDRQSGRNHSLSFLFLSV